MIRENVTEDLAILAAEAEIIGLLARGRIASEEVYDAIYLRALALDEVIAKAAPRTLAGALVKLRRLLDPEIGIEVGPGANDISSLRQVLAFLERLYAEDEADLALGAVIEFGPRHAAQTNRHPEFRSPQPNPLVP
jgi:hypothetical protein